MLKGIIFEIEEIEYIDGFLELSRELKERSIRVFLNSRDEWEGSNEELLLISASQSSLDKALEDGIPCIGFETGKGRLAHVEFVLQGLEDVDAGFLENVHRSIRREPQWIAVTDRLLLREMTVADVEELYELYQEPSITNYIEGLAPTLEEERELTRSYIDQIYRLLGYGYWAVIEKESGSLIGRAGIIYTKLDGEGMLEMGYMIGRPYQRQGYAAEACRAIAAFVEEKLDVREVHALIHPDNRASVLVAEKTGFRYRQERTVKGKTMLDYVLEIESFK